MGYNKSHFKYKQETVIENAKLKNVLVGAHLGSAYGPIGAIVGGATGSAIGWFSGSEKINMNKGHYPVENLTYDDAQEFVRRLSKKFYPKTPQKNKAFILIAPILVYGVYDSILFIINATPAISCILLIVFLVFCHKMWKYGSKSIKEHIERDSGYNF